MIMIQHNALWLILALATRRNNVRHVSAMNQEPDPNSIQLASHETLVFRALTAIGSLHGRSDEQGSDNVASAHATDENDLDNDIRNFKLKHHLKHDAALTLHMIEKDHTVTLLDGLVYGLGELEPVEVYASDAHYILDGELIPLPSVLESRTWIGKVGGDTVMMTKDVTGEINTLDIFGANGSNEYMATVRPGLLATIKPDDLDPESLKKITMSDVSFSEDEEDPYKRALVGAAIQDRNNLRAHQKPGVTRPDQDVRRGGRLLQSSDCSILHVIEVAIAFDSTFCVRHDGGRASRQEIERIVARSSLLYGQQGACAKLVISHLEGFCTEAEDPYRAGVDLNDIGCQREGLLNEFKDYWDANRESVRRDAAHLFYARDLAGPSIGCASTRTLCRKRDAYGVNEMGFSSDEQRRAILFAHELGHNIGLGHVRSANGDRYIMDSVGVGLHIWSPTSLNALATLLPSHDCVSTERQENMPVPPPVSAPVPPLVPVPVQAPVHAPFTAPETAPVTSPTSSTACSSLKVEFAADQWPGDNDFYLQNLETGDFVWDEFDFQKFEVRTKRACIENSGCHYFDLWDDVGDGLLYPGSVKLTYAGKQLYFGGDFGRGFVAYFGDGCAAYQ